MGVRLSGQIGQKVDKSNASTLDDLDLGKRVRVTRTLVFEGPAKWVNDTLDRSWVAPGRPAILPIGGTVTELDRVEEEL